MSEVVDGRSSDRPSEKKAEEDRVAGWRARLNMRQLYGSSPVILLLGLIVAFSALRPDTFATVRNVEIILDGAAVTMVFAVGLTIPLAMGDFDLSIGSLASLVGIGVATLLSKYAFGTVGALVVVVAAGAAVGIINGLLATRFGLSAFIATLAMGSILSGVAFAISGGTNLYQNLSPAFLRLGANTRSGISMPVFIAGGFSAVMWFVLSCTKAGRSIYAIGSNPDVARFAGIRVNAYRMAGFVAAATGATIAGILLTARSAAAYVQAGEGFLIPAYAAAFIGAATFRPGLFQVPGTIVGVLLTALAFNGMTMVGVQGYVQNIVTGGVLIVAIGIAARARRATA